MGFVSLIMNGYVESARAHKDETPCGHDYALRFGTTDGHSMARYDNSHEDKGV